MRAVRLRLAVLAACAGLAPLPAALAATPGEIVIRRDGYGVPHIAAADSRGVMFGVGYALAQDRLAQLEIARRAARGTRAEILGKGAVAGDITARDRWLGDAELMRMYAAIPEEHRHMLQAVVDGINRHVDAVLADPAARTPWEFGQWGIAPTRWTLIDYLGVIAATPSGRGGYELQNLAFLNAMRARHGEAAARTIFEDVVPIDDPDSPTAIPPGEDKAPPRPRPKPGHYPSAPASLARETAEAPPPHPAEDVLNASRCLVIGPGKSASGHVLMLEATADGPESVLQGGGFDTAGFSLTGWGPPIIGRGPHHGWLLTSGHADTTDTFAETIDPNDRYRYFHDGAWRTMAHRTETIRVKDGEAVTHEVAWTVHGPVIRFDPENGTAYAQSFAMRGHEIDNWVAMAEISRASSLDEAVSKGIDRLSWNVGLCYGDEAGNFGFWEAGAFPKRAAGADPRLPMPGSGEYDWQGFLSPAEKPRMINPAQGFIHTWNTKATGWMPEGDDNRTGATFRTWLGTELGARARDVTLLDLRDINRQIFSAFGAQDRSQTSPAFFAPYLRAAAAKSSDPEVRAAIGYMLAFDGRYRDADGDGRYDAPGIALFRAWLTSAPTLIFGPAIGDWWRTVDAGRYHQYRSSLLLRALQGKAAGLPLRFDYFAGRDRDALVAESVRAAIDAVAKDFPGRAMAAWRMPVFWKYYGAAKPDDDRPAYPGGERTPRTAALLGLGPDPVPNNGGEGWAGMMEIAPKIRALYSVTELGGQNLFVDPAGRGNPHLLDQQVMHQRSDFKRIDLSPEVIARDAESVERLRY